MRKESIADIRVRDFFFPKFLVRIIDKLEIQFNSDMTCQNMFHLVAPSAWPLLVSFFACILLLNLVNYMHDKTVMSYFYESCFFFFYFVYRWFKAIILESHKYHTKVVQRGLRLGFILFIFSEVMVFFGFFWSFFAYSLVPSIEIGAVWPPFQISVISPFEIPLYNTVLLLMSGAFVTLSHHSLINNNYLTAIRSLFVTIILAAIFTLLQGYEYVHASFSISDGVYGSIFYLLTGCHGLHVLIGTLFLSVSFFRLLSSVSNPSYNNPYLMTSQNHIGYECAIWYWHFVDVVWLFLYIFVYCSVHTV
jgi:cytochrome c oxidase subunit 3